MRVIIATHSELANGYKKIVEFFFPQTEIVDYISAYVDDEPLEEKFEFIFNRYPETKFFVLTDIKGGSVTQVAVKYISLFNIEIISGLNLPLVFQLLTVNYSPDLKHIEDIIQKSKDEIIHINRLFEGKEEDDD